MKSREHVTTNGRAVFFASMWQDLKDAAKSHGWALGLHGSLNSDMDIMAMPWDEHASPVDVMICQLCICFTDSAQIEKTIKVSTDKPNNRTVYTLSIWADFYLDINVINYVAPSPSQVLTAEEQKYEKQYPHREICGLCHRVSPVGFWVPSDVWKASVHHSRINDIHCLSCFIERADEKLIDWSKEIKFYPVSLRSHIKDLKIQI